MKKYYVYFVLFLSLIFFSSNPYNVFASAPKASEISRELRIENCIDDYIKRQKKSYIASVQDDLYYLMNDFDKIVKKLDGKPAKSSVSREEKLKILARMQCETYYSLGALK